MHLRECPSNSGAHNGFTHLESSRLHHSSAAVVQTGAATAGGAFPLPDQDLCPPDYVSRAHSCHDCSSSGQRRWARWGGAARRTGRGRAHAGSPRARLEFEDSLAQYVEPLGQQDFLSHLGSHAQLMRFEPADAHAQQHKCFGRMPPLAPQQSETAEEFRFMLPEPSQVPFLPKPCRPTTLLKTAKRLSTSHVADSSGKSENSLIVAGACRGDA